jgi:hypothetical protein
MTIRPVNTNYRGFWFRSRLEARWAVFFDAIGLQWEYEKEGYDLGRNGWYLPDFWLPEIGNFIEIKPWPDGAEHGDYWPSFPCHCDPTVDGCSLPHSLIMICGQPWVDDDVVIYPDGCHAARRGLEGFAYEGFVCGDNHYIWTECPVCGRVGIQYEGRAGRLCKCLSANGYDKFYNTMSPRLLSAYATARGARFEHGESVRFLTAEKKNGLYRLN